MQMWKEKVQQWLSGALWQIWESTAWIGKFYCEFATMELTTEDDRDDDDDDDDGNDDDDDEAKF